MLNRVCIIGRLTRDFEVRYTIGAESIAVAKSSIAVNRRKKDEVDFINVLAFGKTAETLAKYTKKGDLIGLDGRIQTGSYEKDGVKHYTFEVVVENITFCQSKGATAGQQDVEENDLPF